MLKQTSQRAGQVIVQQQGPEGFSAFIPRLLPPEPPLQFDTEMQHLLEKANRALGRLDGATYMLPNEELFLYMFVRKEAVLSSQIEGTQASLAELLEYEQQSSEDHPREDIKEVSNYVKAMYWGLERLAKLPISIRLIRGIHNLLLAETRGGQRSPGEFRKSQNWIGGTRPGDAQFVPPPPHLILELMSNLEKFIHHPPDMMPSVIKAGIAHAQFETIHPFLDGNGRIGRLLITLMLCQEKVLEKPLLYLSLFFKKNRPAYYEALNAIRQHGDWEGWIKFYLQGIFEVSQQATEAARSIFNLQISHQERVAQLGRGAHTARQLLDRLYQFPFITVNQAAEALRVSAPTARLAINNLEKSGILKEISGKLRDRQYEYQPYLDIIREGTEL